MLKRVTFTENFDFRAPCAMLLGGFDGMHEGHRKLLERAKGYGLPVGAMTIGGGKNSKNLFTFEEREEIFSRLGVDFAFELPFSEIRDLPPEQFVSLLRDNFDPKAYVCGEDFRFGKMAAGTPELLKRIGQGSVDVEKLVLVDGVKVSSSEIKKLLEEGNALQAARLLGEPFFLRGEVVKDRQVGRTIGFPTANILYPTDKFPLKKGVYEARAEIDGRAYKGIVNFGARPTFDDEKVLTETYLDGFSGDLYGRVIDVEFIRYLRDIQKFDGIEQLKTQLTTDIERVKKGI
jgi:riboflavin kinase/FMN adenylyltransferase